MYRFFSENELACQCGKCGKGQADMDEHFMMKLVALRTALGFPFPITSAFRCPAHNNNVSSTGFNGPHTTGRAVDIQVSGSRAYELISEAKKFGFTGIGARQKGPHGKRFIHLDDLEVPAYPRPHVWGY